MTNVVNVKVAHIRPKYQNLEEWIKNPNNVYIARKGVLILNGRRYPEKDSIWANPFKITDKCDRDSAISQYEVYIRNKLNKGEISVEELLSLSGKVLGCWCKSEACHGDVLVQLIKEYNIDKMDINDFCKLFNLNKPNIEFYNKIINK